MGSASAEGFGKGSCPVRSALRTGACPPAWAVLTGSSWALSRSGTFDVSAWSVLACCTRVPVGRDTFDDPAWAVLVSCACDLRSGLALAVGEVGRHLVVMLHFQSGRGREARRTRKA